MVKNRDKQIDPDEIFMDSTNLPNFDVHQFEGRIEKSISQRTLFVLGGVFLIIFLIFVVRVWGLQVSKGDFYFTKSENNRLRNSLIFAKRGIIYDRTGTELAWNVENPEENSYDLRKYIPLDGLAHLLGYLKYPSKDKYGFYYSDVFDGKDGVEKFYNTELAGQNGKRIIEVDALGKTQSENIIESPTDGENIKLSIDAGLQSYIYGQMKELSTKVGFDGGAGVIMNVESGEVLALVSYPEYNSQTLTDGKNTAEINKYLTNKNNPFLSRAVDGLYTPGSTVKPFMGYAALSEKIIDPYKDILSTGALTLPNPYDPEHPTIFKDWKAHGYVDMRKAIAVSSDVYFYEVGGGFQDQKGLGITLIDKYLKMFGFGVAVPASSPLFNGPVGVIPSPEWKAQNFEGEEWRVGNTYHTSIGQYGFQVSPLQLVRSVSALANGGTLITPQIILDKNGQVPNSDKIDLHLDQANLKVVREGMRDTVIKDYGLAKSFNSPNYSVAMKTGTAELGVYKKFVNSLASGFYPYENPKYAFVIIMERGPIENPTGASFIMHQALEWMVVNRPEYLK